MFIMWNLSVKTVSIPPLINKILFFKNVLFFKTCSLFLIYLVVKNVKFQIRTVLYCLE